MNVTNPMMERRQARHGVVPLHLLLIAVLIISRRPDAIFHPQFWAEDGQVFYHDAYASGPQSLLFPLGGYMNTFSRLVALFATRLPLVFAPSIFAAFAFIAQLLPVFLMLSGRMSAALPSRAGRLAVVYFYVGMPNSYELNVNLTNAQWHLAMLAFLLVVATPASGAAGRTIEAALLVLSGLSGPFDVFLVPIAWVEHRERRAGNSLRNALILSVTAAVQLGVILALHGTSARLATPLGASPSRLLHILTNQFVFGSLLGQPITTRLLTFSALQGTAAPVLVVIAAMAILCIACAIGPAIYRKAVFWAAALLAAALISPIGSRTMPQWVALTHPGYGLRYFIIPGLVWFATWMIIAASPWRPLRAAGCGVVWLTVVAAGANWTYPAFAETGFYTLVAKFDAASPGTVVSFPENPPGWTMILIKQ